MNIKRAIFWACFVVVLGLIVWGLVASMGKGQTNGTAGTPAPISSADHARGPMDAPVVLLEYSDLQCPACGAYHPLVEKVLASSTIPIRMVYRHYPLPQHKNAFIAAQASEAAAMQGKFWEMENLLFTYQDQWSELADPREIFSGYALRIGLNVEKFKSDMDSDIAKNIVTAQRNEAQKIGINKTPTFFLNGKEIESPQGYEQFKAAIEAAAK